MPRKIPDAPATRTAPSALIDLPAPGMLNGKAAAGAARPSALRRDESAGEGTLGGLMSAATRLAQMRRPGNGNAAAPVVLTAAPTITAAISMWVSAAPRGEIVQRKAIARLIERTAADKSPDLHISDLQVTSLPDCIGRMSLKNLTIVNCGLAELPQLPPELDSLTVNRNRLRQLPRLPAMLRHVDASANALMTVPRLPVTIAHLNLRGNCLQALEALPAHACQVDVSDNQLPALPALPATLTHLNVSMNPLSRLPALPASLLQLQASHTKLSVLPPLPKKLARLQALDNQLQTLPALPATLTHLNVSENYLTSLPPLPPAMVQLILNANLLTQLPRLPQTLSKLDVGHNRLAAMPVDVASLPDLVNISFAENRIPPQALETALQMLHRHGKNMTHVAFRQRPHEAAARDAAPAAIRPAEERDGWELLQDAAAAEYLLADQWEVIASSDRRGS